MNRLHDDANDYLPPDFEPAAMVASHLVWTDAESGEELSIELVAPHQFLRDLQAEGFALRTASPASRPAQSCRIEAESSN
jgi:hypothetical protein